MTTEFWARTDEYGNVQFLNTHTENVAGISASFSLLPNVSRLSGLLHDVGKASVDWQAYLKLGDKSEKLPHAPQGAVFVEDSIAATSPYAGLLKELLELIVYGHHNHLSDCVSLDGSRVFFDFAEQTENTDYHYEEIKENALRVIGYSSAEWTDLLTNAEREMQDINNKILQIYGTNKTSLHFARGLLVKYLYSCLVDADRYDAYLFEVGMQYRCEPYRWDGLIARLETHLAGFAPTNELNRIRCDISQKCRAAAEKETGIYRLCVPTGGGKTLSSLRFALHHAKKYGKKRIIYVIPYLSVIEQTAKTVRDALGLDDGFDILLEHHSNLVKTEDETEQSNRDLATQRWDAPLVITTMVRFLETAMSARAGDLRKFHNLQDSVLIFDEIQSLPIKAIHLFNETVSFLSKLLGATVVLCTATQPLIERTERRNLLVSAQPNLIEDTEQAFTRLRRTKVVAEHERSTEEFAEYVYDKCLAEDGVLVIVNTKNTARKVYRILKSRADAGEFRLYHLSTVMCGAHRLQVLNEIKEMKKHGKVVCIATQLIEAGVDISFPCVIRALAGLDSIAQAAGRCNRNAESAEPKIVYVVPISDERIDLLPEIQVGKQVSARVFSERPDADFLCQETMDYFYGYYYEETEIKRQMDDPLKKLPTTVYDLLAKNRYGCGNYRNKKGAEYRLPFGQAFATASENFRVIDADTVSVVVPYCGSELLLEAYRAAKDFKTKLKYLQKLQRYSVSLYRNDFEKLLIGNIIYKMQDEFEIPVLNGLYYSLEFGVKFEIDPTDTII